jgi:two-component system response regulator AlgR
MGDGVALRALAIDDEPLAIERLQILCADISEVQLVGTANDAASALRLIEALRPDLLLLDIAMPGMTGVELARLLAERPVRPRIVFVTAFDQFAVAAFDVQAVDYLMKPVQPDRLRRAVQRAAAQGAPAPEEPQWLSEFWVPHRGEIIRIAAADIEWVEAERDYMRLHVGGRSFLIHQTIAELERRLDPARFLRVHRSAIVRRDQVAKLAVDRGGAWSVTLACGRTQPVGRSYLAGVKAMAGRC